jgi:hypothetical protein
MRAILKVLGVLALPRCLGKRCAFDRPQLNSIIISRKANTALSVPCRIPLLPQPLSDIPIREHDSRHPQPTGWRREHRLRETPTGHNACHPTTAGRLQGRSRATLDYLPFYIAQLWRSSRLARHDCQQYPCGAPGLEVSAEFSSK